MRSALLPCTWSQTNDMGSNKTMENFNVTYLTVCQDPKPVCTYVQLSLGTKGCTGNQ